MIQLIKTILCHSITTNNAQYLNFGNSATGIQYGQLHFWNEELLLLVFFKCLPSYSLMFVEIRNEFFIKSIFLMTLPIFNSLIIWVQTLGLRFKNFKIHGLMNESVGKNISDYQCMCSINPKTGSVEETDERHKGEYYF